MGRTEKVERSNIFRTPKTNAPLKGGKSGHQLIWLSSHIWTVGMMCLKHLEDRPHFWLLFWTNVWSSYGAQMCPRKILAENKHARWEVGKSQPRWVYMGSESSPTCGCHSGRDAHGRIPRNPNPSSPACVGELF